MTPTSTNSFIQGINVVLPPTNPQPQTAKAAAPGLTQEEARSRLSEYGYNELTEEKVHPLRKFLSYFWGPIPWMIEVAAVLSLIVQHWVDFGVIFALLVFNAAIGFWQEYQAGNAIAALKEKLALKARVKRDGRWTSIAARELVPGDLIRLRLGDIVPADAKLADGEYLSVDQSALTGESLPVEKKPGDEAYSGSMIRQGEMEALVTATAANTYFGKTAKLVEKAGAVSHFQKAVLTIGDYLIYLSLALAAVLVLTQLFRGQPALEVFQFVLILVVAAIPVAMPAVLSVTMALGALALSKMKAIVSRLQSIEEIAGIDILCSDKTGTLTQNKLTLGEPVSFDSADAQQLVLAGALASKEEDARRHRRGGDRRSEGPQDIRDLFPSEIHAVRSGQQADRGRSEGARRQDLPGDQGGAAGDPGPLPARGGTDPADRCQGGGVRRTRIPHAGRRPLRRRTARGGSWACCRCSIRRGRTRPRPSGRPRSTEST